jgi:amino acid permease
MFRNIFSKNSNNGTSNNSHENSFNDNEILVTPNKESLHRNLKERHMIMIALGGTIGTGLFLASGQALASAGPAGSLVSYGCISVMVYFVMTSLGKTCFLFLHNILYLSKTKTGYLLLFSLIIS